jgi:hypothetical protein
VRVYAGDITVKIALRWEYGIFKNGYNQLGGRK